MIDSSNVSLSCAQCPAASAAVAEASGSTPPPPPPPPSSSSSSSSSSSLSPTGHAVVAACLGSIGTLGFVCNSVVLAMFLRYRALRTPINLLLVSISVSDLLVSVLGTPFSFAASLRGRWLIGRAGCVWYGFVNACLGIVSLISLAVLSYERYCTMTVPNMADGRDFRPALGGICFSWLYSMAWTVPPLLGWSRYGPEGPGTTCSVDWRSQTANNVSYVLCLFAFCLVLPFGVIVFSYGKLLLAIRQVRSRTSLVTRRRERRVLLMVLTMVVCYLVCWLPYGVVALMATLGPGDPLGPEASVLPSLLAKSSTVVNPFIYIFMNKQFYRCFRAFFRCSDVEPRSSLKTFSRATKTLRSVRPELRECPPSSARASAPPPPPPPTTRPGPKLTLVAHYRK
ncbi:teleost multiple tissue opsin b [Syngnathoides biaculeatus]|uniref:teleost multiple tissue opsin b n=1 Tax=Syngnathoides biaculeatus TaxID=300417 RepID=UPI002ADDBB1B|nr:teleost multiple tissue opsin b [Syngnathoides biaculeatus]